MANKRVQINSFCGGTSKLVDSAFLGFEESVNMYPETVDAQDTYTKRFLKSLEGLTRTNGPFDFITTTETISSRKTAIFMASKSPENSPNEGAPVLCVIFNSTLYRIYKDGSVLAVCNFIAAQGEMAQIFNTDITVAETSGDPSYLIVCANGYVFPVQMKDTETTFKTVRAMVMPTSYVTNGAVRASSVAYLNFRIVVSEENSDYIYWSELNKPNGVNDNRAFQQQLTKYAYTKNDGTVVSFSDNVYYPPAYGTYQDGTLTKRTEWMGALNNVKVDFKADNVKKLVSLDTKFIAFGSRSYQVFEWQNNLNVPYITTGKTSDIGLGSEKTTAVFDNHVFFLGAGTSGDNRVFMLGENGIEKISNTAIEQRIAAVEDKSEVFGFVYSYKNHSFYVLSFPNANDDFTICYDMTEGIWHNRASVDDNGDLHVWDAAGACTIYDKVFFSRYSEISVYTFDKDSFRDFGYKNLVRSRTTGIKFENLDDVIIRSLELVTDNGAGKNLDVDPRVMLQVSTDGGFTWSSEKWVKSGKVGQRNFRTLWRDLGKGSRIAFKVKVTDGAPFNIASAFLEYAPLKNRIG